MECNSEYMGEAISIYLYMYIIQDSFLSYGKMEMLLDRIKVCFLSKTFQILKKVLYFCMFYHVDKFPQNLCRLLGYRIQI